MKKSELYHIAMMAVMQSPSISPESKIEVLKVLIDDESLELYREKQKEE